MCAGCDEYAEYERMVDEVIERELPAMLAQPLERAIIYGCTPTECRCGSCPTVPLAFQRS